MKKHPKKKRTPQQSRFKKPSLHYINIFIITLSVILLGVITNIFIFEDNNTSTETPNKEIIQKQIPIEKQTIEKKENEALHHERFEEQTKALEIEYIDTNSQDVISSHKQNNYQFIYDNEAIKPIENNISLPIKKEEIEKVEVVQKEIPQQKTTQKALPKLVIIIDDVSASHQVRAIKNIGYPVTMAFLPPTKNHPNSATIAKNVKNYMVHLPLEASKRNFEEDKTLHIGDSLKTIEKRIGEIQKLYPNTKYINNHTGSKFTSDYDSMDKLFKILKKYNYTFIDSKTIGNTPTKELAKKYKLKTFTRNIFLDNVHKEEYIQNQLKKAITMAKQTGFAIAIGHPHKVTTDTLKKSKHLLEGLELVYINEL